MIKKAFKLYQKVRDPCHYTGKNRGAAHNICNLRYKTPKEILVVFHNDSTYDYRFIIEEIAKEFDSQFECLGENTEKYITFFVLIKKVLDNGKIITYKLKFIVSFRFMSSKLSDLVNNLSEIYSKDCKGCKEEKKSNQYVTLQDLKIINDIIYATTVKKRRLKPINRLTKKYPNKYEFCNGDINKFNLLLRNGVYPYEYMDSWKRFDETLLPDKKAFYSELILEDITEEYYIYAQKVFEELKIKNLGAYHDLYVQSDTLLLACIFGNFRNKCIETYELDTPHFCLHLD